MLICLVHFNSQCGMFLLSKGQEYKAYIAREVTYFTEVARSNVTVWAEYTRENAPMATLNLIGSATVKAKTTVLWLNNTRSQSLNVTLRQVETYVNQTVLEVVDYLNKTLNGSSEMLLKMTWNGINKTINYANLTVIYINETVYYVRDTSVKVCVVCKNAHKCWLHVLVTDFPLNQTCNWLPPTRYNHNNNLKC